MLAVLRRLADEERGQEFLVDHVKLVVSDVMTKLRGKAFDSISEALSLRGDPDKGRVRTGRRKPLCGFEKN